MPYDFGEFLFLAEELSQRGDQASHRSSISRAYYATYHAARRVAPLTAQELIDLRGRHQKLWHRLKRIAAYQSIASRGEQLMALRTRADYDNPFPMLVGETRIQAGEAVDAAKVIIDDLSRMSQN